MVTLYELLGVDENANKDVIKNAYEARMGHPALDDKKKNQLKIAVDILLDDVKREKYNKDLSNYRAQELLKNVAVTNENTNEKILEQNNNVLEDVQDENIEETKSSRKDSI